MALGNDTEDWADEKAGAIFRACQGLGQLAVIKIVADTLREVQQEFSGPLERMVRAQARDLASYSDRLNKSASTVAGLQLQFENERRANEGLQAALKQRDETMKVWAKIANPPFVVMQAAAHVESLAPKFVGYQCTCQTCGTQFISSVQAGYCPEHVKAKL